VLLPALAVTLLAADPVTVSLSSKRAGAEAFAPKVLARVRAALSTHEIQSNTDDRANDCQGATDCLRNAAKPNTVLIGVDVGRIANSLAIHLEAVRQGGGKALAVADIPATVNNWSNELTDPLEAFITQLASKLPKTPEPAASAPAPSTHKPIPKVIELQPSEGEEGPPSKLRWVTTVAAVLSVAAGATCLGLGLNEKSVIDGSINAMGLSTLPQTQYDAHRSQGNAELTASLITLILGGALAILSIVLFAVD
jgi:hypothetical protein